MSRSTIIFFEFKKKGESTWNLFAPLIKKTDFYLPYHAFLKPNVMVNGEEYVYSFQDDIQGTIRDYCDDSNQDFYRRGFPKDMSEDLKAYLDKEKENGGLEYTWGHSWVTTDEFKVVIEKDISVAQERITEYTSKSEFEKLHDKLDIILKTINNETIVSAKTNKDDEDSYYDYLSYIDELKEEIDCLTYAKQYIEGVEQMISILNNAWVDTYDIRLVYFTA
jgi:hypothetical protein